MKIERRMTIIHVIEDGGKTERVGFETDDEFLQIELLGILSKVRHAILTEDLTEVAEEDEVPEDDFVCRHPWSAVDDEGRCQICQEIVVENHAHCVHTTEVCVIDNSRHDHPNKCCDCKRPIR